MTQSKNRIIKIRLLFFAKNDQGNDLPACFYSDLLKAQRLTIMTRKILKKLTGRSFLAKKIELILLQIYLNSFTFFAKNDQGNDLPAFFYSDLL